MVKTGACEGPRVDGQRGRTGQLPRFAPALPKGGPACRRCPARQECAAHAARFLQGYELPLAGRARLPEWRRTRPALSVLTAVADVAWIFAVAVLHLLLLGYSLWLAALAYLPALILVSRMLRGLEVLVHEGSHYNWTRRRGRNDVLVNVFAGFAVFQTVQGYRVAHARHHKHLGADDDPCRKRFMTLGWADLSRGSAGAYLRGMIANWLPYWINWWKFVGGDRRVPAWAPVWHLGVIVFPLAAVLGLRFNLGAGESAVLALAAWVAYVGTAFVAVLPTLRFMAEAAEHDYRNGTTTKTGTYSNVGPVHWILHPHGDGHHFLHHVDASIPHHRLRVAHRWLTANDAEYATSRRRERVLQDVVLHSIGAAGSGVARAAAPREERPVFGAPTPPAMAGWRFGRREAHG
jgi:fatty acid desaturase